MGFGPFSTLPLGTPGAHPGLATGSRANTLAPLVGSFITQRTVVMAPYVQTPKMGVNLWGVASVVNKHLPFMGWQLLLRNSWVRVGRTWGLG